MGHTCTHTQTRRSRGKPMTGNRMVMVPKVAGIGISHIFSTFWPTILFRPLGKPVLSHHPFPSRLNRISSFTKKTDQRNTVNPWKCRTDSKSIQPSLGETAKRRRRCDVRGETVEGALRWKERCGGVKGGFPDVLLQKWKRKGSCCDSRCDSVSAGRPH